MKKPVYKYPDFITEIKLNKTDTKRYWLKLTIDKSKTETIVVILKNPSRANDKVSDKTVYNVSSYIYKNRDSISDFSEIGTIIILNLIPHYQTYSDKLEPLKDKIIDAENLKFINKFTSNHKKVIIAWGNAPKGLKKEYNQLRQSTLDILSENEASIFYIDKLSKELNPKHGQIWGYADELKKYC
jgi:hypothetical protein